MDEPLNRIDVRLEGIGGLIAGDRLAVPDFQRSYAWREEQVNNLLQDLNGAIRDKAPEYFLGTVVLSENGRDRKIVIDGQQRIATTMMFIAEVRNFFIARGEVEIGDAIHRDYIGKLDRRTLEDMPNLVLNETDNPHFVTAVVDNEETGPGTGSSPRIAAAKEVVADFVDRIAGMSHDPEDDLNDWLDYLEKRAKVIVVTVGSEVNAYAIFEVLNDRGISLSTVDLLKNHLFRVAKDRLKEVRTMWTSMCDRIESVSDERDIGDISDFVRHVWSSWRGPTRRRQLYGRISEIITRPRKSVDFAERLNRMADEHVALRNPDHPRWRNLGPETREAVRALGEIGIMQNRPLIYAVLDRFPDKEIRLTLPMLVAWSVRFLICGSSGMKLSEHPYSSMAEEISLHEVETAEKLYLHALERLPDDRTFQDHFSKAIVIRNSQARYYLGTIAMMEEKAREHRIDHYPEEVNLEHVLPRSPGAGWNRFSPEEAAHWHNRMGNLTILDRQLNTEAKNDSFDRKKVVYARSGMELTRSLSRLDEWTTEQIADRQMDLAIKAVDAWPLDPAGRQAMNKD